MRTSRTEPRARTVSIKRLSKRALLAEAALYPVSDHHRPRKRLECVGGARPCPFVSCRHHLYLDVHPVRGSIKLNFPEREVWELEESCSLDVADRGGATLEETGELLNLTRERVRQLETMAAQACATELEPLRELLEELPDDHPRRPWL